MFSTHDRKINGRIHEILSKDSFFGQYLSRGNYQPTYQPPEGVYSLIVPTSSRNLVVQSIMMRCTCSISNKYINT